MAKILRITRHPVGEEQIAELKRIYGSDLEIVEVAEQVDAAKVKQLIEEYVPDVLEATLPMSMVAELTGPKGISIPLIRAKMRREEQEGDPTIFHFEHYLLVKKVEVVTEVL